MGILTNAKHYFSLIKFSHTVFAMPFAIAGFSLGLQDAAGTTNLWGKIVFILLCMVLARNAAMSFNRFADRNYDALNPRTRFREIPARILKPQPVLYFAISNAVLFVFITFFINTLSFLLSPLALLIIMGYSFTKRFTWLSHLVLGFSLSVAPVGAYIAVTGSFALAPLLLSGLVMFWVAGFDILYALQDLQFDKTHRLFSIPAVMGERFARLLSIIMHVLCLGFVLFYGLIFKSGCFFWVGAGLFTTFIVYQHLLVRLYGLKKIDTVFFTANGFAGITFVLFFCLDLFFF